MESITERLSNLIAAKGIRGVDLAETTSVNPSTISRILKGTQMPTADTLYKFAQFFDVTMEFLLTGENAISKNCVNADFISEESRLISYYRKMDIADQEDILLIAEMKANKGKRQNNAKSSPTENDDMSSETA